VTSSTSADTASTARLGLALLACALAVRPLAVSIGPLLPEIQRDIGLSDGASGIVGMLPVVCLGLFAPVGVALATRIRPARALAVALAIALLSGIARAASPTPVVLMLLTVGLGIGIGMAGAIPAMIIRARAPGAPARLTAMHGIGVVGGAALGAALIVPFVGFAGNWRAATILLSVPLVAAAVAGLLLLGRDPGTAAVRGAARLAWADRIAWLMAAIFGLQSLIYWSVLFWIAAILVDLGWSSAGAGAMAAVFQIASFLAVVATGPIASRFGTRRGQLATVAGATTAAMVGMAVAPGLAGLWVVVAGAALGAAFPLALTLPVDFSVDASDAGSKASLTLLVGYLVAAGGPPVVGLVRESTADVGPIFVLLSLCGAGFVAFTLLLPAAGRWRPVDIPITSD
jgi:CP family cyanate transporter-like MFS transporter